MYRRFLIFTVTSEKLLPQRARVKTKLTVHCKLKILLDWVGLAPDKLKRHSKKSNKTPLRDMGWML